MKDKKSIYILQFIRFFSALIVFLSHFYSYDYVGSLRFVGRVGVAFFFMISGFLLIYRNNMHHYFVNKIFRICPLYYLTTTLIYILAVLKPELLRTTVANPMNLIKSIFFIPFYVSTPSGPGLWPIYTIGWTLNIEFFVYILYWICFRIKKNRIWAGVLSSIIMCSLVVVGFHSSSNLFVDSYCQPYLLWFVIGLLISCLKIRLEKTSFSHIEYRACNRWDSFSLKIQSLILVLVTIGMVGISSLYEDNWFFFIILGTIFLFFILLLGKATKFPEIFIIGGNISYSMYLTHYFVVCIFLRILFSVY